MGIEYQRLRENELDEFIEMRENMDKRESFSSRLGFILVSAGCAVGLGNVWKFPYICGQNGGAAFIIIYLIFLFLLGLPILICEFAVGRGSAKGPARAYNVLEKKGSKWHFIKWFSIIGCYLLMMFYTMVGGWMMYYVYQMTSGEIFRRGAENISSAFNEMLQAPGTMTVWMIIAVALSLAVCSMGLQNGIEKITKVMMTLLTVLIVILAFHSLMLPNAVEGVKFYLVPNFDSILKRGLGTVIFDAMSHAFFTLSVGIGSMHIFGSYLKRDNTLLSESGSVVLLDTFVALMAGFIILPACFAYGVEPDVGPSLLFISLPNVFLHMDGGQIWGIFFFVFMSFASLSTIIAVFENIIAFYMDEFGWERRKAVIINIILIPVLSMPAVLGYNILSGLQPLGAGTTIMDLEDFLVSYNLLPLGSLIYVLFCTRKNGWGWDSFLNEVNTGAGKKLSSKLRLYFSYILPVIIIVIYLKGYYDTFAKMGVRMLAFWMTFAVLLLGFVMAVAFYRKEK